MLLFLFFSFLYRLFIRWFVISKAVIPPFWHTLLLKYKKQFCLFGLDFLCFSPWFSITYEMLSSRVRCQHCFHKTLIWTEDLNQRSLILKWHKIENEKKIDQCEAWYKRQRECLQRINAWDFQKLSNRAWHTGTDWSVVVLRGRCSGGFLLRKSKNHLKPVEKNFTYMFGLHMVSDKLLEC